MNKNFIITQDEQTALALEKLGFRLINKNATMWTFANCQALCFSKDIDLSKIVYSNMFVAS